MKDNNTLKEWEIESQAKSSPEGPPGHNVDHEELQFGAGPLRPVQQSGRSAGFCLGQSQWKLVQLNWMRKVGLGGNSQMLKIKNKRTDTFVLFSWEKICWKYSKIKHERFYHQSSYCPRRGTTGSRVGKSSLENPNRMKKCAFWARFVPCCQIFFPSFLTPLVLEPPKSKQKSCGPSTPWLLDTRGAKTGGG